MDAVSHKKLRKFSGGFTMFEMVIVIAIIIALSAVVLFSFTSLNQGTALNRSARDFSIALRRAQNMSLAVANIDTSSGPIIPKVVGIRVSLLDPGRYFTFADLNANGKWDPLTDAKIGNNYDNLERNIRITALDCRNIAPPPSYVPCPSTVDILFSSPEATLTLTNDSNGTDIGDIVIIHFGKATGSETRTATIRTSGQISIK